MYIQLNWKVVIKILDFFLDNCTGLLTYIGDLYCDDENNNIYCQFDGGDCCNILSGQTDYLTFCEECACFRGKLIVFKDLIKFCGFKNKLKVH